MRVIKLFGQMIMFSSMAGATLYATKMIPHAWREGKTDKLYAAEILYGSALVGAITGFQLMLTAPMLLPQEIAERYGIMEHAFNIAMVHYTAYGQKSSVTMDYATKLNPIVNEKK